MKRARAIKQRDIVLIALDPTAGTEIRGTRPVLVLSNTEFNRSGSALIAPITQGGNIQRIEGWAVTLMGADSQEYYRQLTNEIFSRFSIKPEYHQAACVPNHSASSQAKIYAPDNGSGTSCG